MADVLKIDFAEAMGIAGAAMTSLMGEKFGGFGASSGVVDHTYASLPVGEFAMTKDKLAGGGGNQSVQVDVVIREETMQDIVARANARIQLMGDNFVLTE